MQGAQPLKVPKVLTVAIFGAAKRDGAPGAMELVPLHC